MFRLHLIIQNEPFYIPKMVQQLINRQKETYKIVSYTILKPSRKNKNIYSWINERTKIYLYSELFLVASLYFYTKFYSLFSNNSPYSCKSIFNKSKIIEITTNDINNAHYLQILKDQSPDFILSISCPQLFESAILSIPKIACINAHGTLLPRHRGVFGSFWTLFCGDSVAGATLHTMEEKLDAGLILWQKEFSIKKEDTQYSIAYKTKYLMTLGLIELFEIYSNTSPQIIAPIYSTSYHRAPTKEEGRIFHRKGYRIICLRDIKNILAKSFKQIESSY